MEVPLTASLTEYASGLAVVSTSDDDVAAFALATAEVATARQAAVVLIFFSQSLFSADLLAAELGIAAPGLHYAACSTAGEITPDGLQDRHAIAVVFPGDRFETASMLVTGIASTGVNQVAARVKALRLAMPDCASSMKVFALCLIDGLSRAEEAVTSAIHWQLGDIPLIGGSAGDELNFRSTTLIHNGVVASDSAIVLLFATQLPFRVFKTDNFVATDIKLVVTESDPESRIVHEFNAAPATEEYADAVGVVPSDLSPFSFASHPTIVKVGGQNFCRSIQKANDDGSLSYFCAIDNGVVLSIARAVDVVQATRTALAEVDEELGGADVVLGFDCVLRRLDAVNRQVVRELSEVYKSSHVVGFGTYGEQYQSMHLNQTFTGIAFGAGVTG